MFSFTKYSAINKEGFNVLSRRRISYDMQWSTNNVIVTAPNIRHDLRMILCRVASRGRKQLDSIAATGRRIDATFLDRETK